MIEHEHINPEDISFEEFNKLVDESEEVSCGLCFSFGQFKHLNESTRKIAYLAYSGLEEERVEMLAEELERLKEQPIDDNIYFLVLQAELLQTNNIKLHFLIVDNVLARARELVAKKMPAAWVAVRSYAWIKEVNLAVLPEFLDATDDLDVWQVVMQCISKYRLSLPDLFYCRDKVYLYTVKAIEMGNDTKPRVVAANGVQALMRLHDERALELYHRITNDTLKYSIHEAADRLIKQLTKERQGQYIPTLMEIKLLSEKKPPA